MIAMFLLLGSVVLVGILYTIGHYEYLKTKHKKTK